MNDISKFITISPKNDIIIKGQSSSLITVQNTGQSPIGFKIKSSLPQNLMATPKQGIVSPNSQKSVELKFNAKNSQNHAGKYQIVFWKLDTDNEKAFEKLQKGHANGDHKYIFNAQYTPQQNLEPSSFHNIIEESSSSISHQEQVQQMKDIPQTKKSNIIRHRSADSINFRSNLVSMTQNNEQNSRFSNQNTFSMVNNSFNNSNENSLGNNNNQFQKHMQQQQMQQISDLNDKIGKLEEKIQEKNKTILGQIHNNKKTFQLNFWQILLIILLCLFIGSYINH